MESIRIYNLFKTIVMEIWKDIDGFRELYQVSNLGRVRRRDTFKVLKPLNLSKDYKGVRLYVD